MIQDLAPGSFDLTYRQPSPADDDLVGIFDGQDLLLRGDAVNGISFPAFSELTLLEPPFYYGFTLGGRRFFIYAGPDPHPSVKGCHWEHVKVLRCDLPRGMCFAGMTAYQLYRWYRQHRFCGQCGRPLQLSAQERALVCPQCGLTIYPQIVPAVVVGVTDGDRLLVTRYNHRTYRGTALIAGFCEIGETAEDTVRREIREEVGLEVGAVRYFGSQPWGLESNLMLGFFAPVRGSTAIIREPRELSEAFWIKAAEIPYEHEPVTLTHHMMMHFRAQYTNAPGDLSVG